MTYPIIRRQRPRSRTGNMLALAAAVFIGIMMLILAFGLNYVRFLGSHQQQNTAIEAGALAAANDISRIVVNTNECGYVSLSDDAPVGNYTQSNPNGTGDYWDLPVRSVNTLIGTTRLECVVADIVGATEGLKSEGVFTSLAAIDNQNCQSVVKQLTAAINNSISGPGQSGYDINGNQIFPYDDAQTAYTTNLIKMTGGSNYVGGSMKITLGCMTQGIATNTYVPNPQSGNWVVPASQQQNGYYLSDTDVPYTTKSGTTTDFMFGAVGSSARLVDYNLWTNTYPLPQQGNAKYQVPAVVKVQASQLIKNSQYPNGLTVQDTAAAAGASVYDPRPAPGALTYSFPDGCPPELTRPSDLLTFPKLQSSWMQTYWSQGGDYPTPNPPATNTVQLSPLVVQGLTPVSGTNSFAVSDVFCTGIYDWVRRAGTKANLNSVSAMLTTPFNPQNNGMMNWRTTTTTGSVIDMTAGTPSGQGWNGTGSIFASGYKGAQIPIGIVQIYRWNPDGTINYGSRVMLPYPYQCVSENQMYGEGAGNSSSGGGFTAGVPIGCPMVSATPLITFTPLTVPQILTYPLPPNSTVAIEPFYDVYVRDQSRFPGDNWGGQHAGEPLDDNTTAYNPSLRVSHNQLSFGRHGQTAFDDLSFCGLGAQFGGPPGGGGGGGGGKGGGGAGSIPLIGTSDDFDLTMSPVAPYQDYSQGPGGAPQHIRPTYQTNGSAIDIRFRREVFVTGSLSETVTESNPTPPPATINVTTYSSVADVGYLAQEVYP